MAHSHAHSDTEARSTYFLDQLCTIAFCGLLGVTAILAYQTGMLTRIKLHNDFHIPVLLSGVALIVMVVLRAAVIWTKSGQVAGPAETCETSQPEKASSACGHEHTAGEQCNHDHAHAHDREHSGAGASSNGEQHSHAHAHAHSHAESHEGHAHSHSHAHEQREGNTHEGHDHSHSHAQAPSHGDGHDDHEHGWSPWQYAILIIPAVLFFLRLPAEGYNSRVGKELEGMEKVEAKVDRRVALANFTGGTAIVALKKSGGPVSLKFSELAIHAGRAKSREYFEGRTVILKGQFSGAGDKDNVFKLFRVKISCCQSDAITLKSLIISPEPINPAEYKYQDWVEIKGEISFQKMGQGDEWLPVIHLVPEEGLKKIPKPENAEFEDA